MARVQTQQHRPRHVVCSPAVQPAPLCKPEIPEGTVNYFISNELVQEDAASALQWLLSRHPKSELAKSIADAVEGLCNQMKLHMSDILQQTRILKALCMVFREFPDSPQHVVDASTLLGCMTSSLRRHQEVATIQELACRACAAFASEHADILASSITLFVDALLRFPRNVDVQETASSCIADVLSAAVDGAAPAVKASDRGVVTALVFASRQLLDNEIVSSAVVRALAAVFDQHPRSCAKALEIDAVSALRGQLARHPLCTVVQIHALNAFALMFYRQPKSASRASDLKTELVFLAALQNHFDSEEVQAEASNAVAWMVAGHNDAAEAVALCEIPDFMIDGLQKHIRIKPVQETVCHALGQLFGVNNAIFSTAMRLRSFNVLMELIRREPTSAGTQMYASLGLANLCAHHSGSAQDAVSAGAFELLLQAHRCHHKDEHIRSCVLLSAARIIESYPLGIARGVEAGITTRFEKALHEMMFDGSGMNHVAAALAQIYIFLISERSALKASLEALAKLLERHPKSTSGATRAGAAKVLTEVLHTSAADASLLTTASCALGHIFRHQALYAKIAVDCGFVKGLIAAMQSHLSDRALQAQAAQSLVFLMQALPTSADVIADSGGPEAFHAVAQTHPDAADVKLHVSTAFRILGRLVPALTPFPFVPAPPEEG